MDERNLDLVVRNENTRDKFQTEVVRFELDQILQHFVEAIQTINAQFDVVDELIESGKVIEGENIWRAQIIFLASALDFYMHELTKYGLCEIYNENWNHTDKYENLQFTVICPDAAMDTGCCKTLGRADAARNFFILHLKIPLISNLSVSLRSTAPLPRGGGSAPALTERLL